MSGRHDRAAGWLAVAAAAAGVGAAVAILLPGLTGNVPPGAEDVDEVGAEAARTERGAARDEAPGPAVTERRASAWDAGRGPEAGVVLEALAEARPVASAVLPEPSRVRRSPEELAAARAEAERVAATLTPEQRYEAQAFFHDLLILRADALRTQIAAAREAGDERALRRLEPALAIVDAELARAAERTRALEAELGRDPSGASGAGEATPAESPPDERSGPGEGTE
jgi:hypothetical protein